MRRGAEHFTPAPDTAFQKDFARRELLRVFFRTETERPDILETGLDLAKLQAEIKKHGGSIDLNEAGSTDLGSIMRTAFDQNTKYLPLEAVKGHEAEVRPELAALYAYQDFLHTTLEQLTAEAGVKGERKTRPEFIVGVEQKEKGVSSNLVGGFHSPLLEQGFKLFDELSIINLENETDNREVYRTVGLLRAASHDAIHSIQYKLYSPHSENIIRSEEKLQKLEAETSPLMTDDQKQNIDRLKREGEQTNLHSLQYGTFFSGGERKHIQINNEALQISFGAVLFEYVTDQTARKMVNRYLEQQHKTLPPPVTPFENVQWKDLHGERVKDDDTQNLKPFPDGDIAKYAQDYGRNILRPAQYFFSLLGSYGAEAERAIFLDAITGKLTNCIALRKKIEANGFKTEDGNPIDMNALEPFLQGSPAVRALLRPSNK